MISCPTAKREQPWRVNFYQSGRALSVVQGEDNLWYIFHHHPEREGLALGELAYTGGGVDHQADAVDEAMAYLKTFGGPVTVS